MPAQSNDTPENSSGGLQSMPVRRWEPAPLELFSVTEEQWENLRQRVSSIRSDESALLTAIGIFLTAGISATFGASQSESTPTWVSYVIGGGYIGAAICLVGYFRNRGQRQNSTKSALCLMDQIKQRQKAQQIEE